MEEHTIEQGFANLEELIKKMESQEVTLDDSFELYKKGMEELQYCGSKIEATKKAVMAINKDGSIGVFEEEN